MPVFFRALRLAAAFLLALNSPTLLAATPPLEAYASLPAMQRVVLSPKGRRIAMIVNEGPRTMLVSQDVDDPQRQSRLVMDTDNLRFQFMWMRWVNEDRLVVSVGTPAKRNNIDTMETRLLSVRFDGSQAVNLVKQNYFRGDFQAQLQDHVVDFRPDDGKHIYLEVGGGQYYDFDPAVYSVDVENGSRSIVHPKRQDFSDWMTDENHRVRLGYKRDKEFIEIHACDPDGNNWRMLWRFKILAQERVYALGFGKDPNELFIAADHQGRRAIFSVDLRDATLARRLKLADANVDVSAALVRAPGGEVVGIRRASSQRGAAGNYWDEKYRGFIASIDEALPQRMNFITGMSDDGARYVFVSENSQTPAEYYLGDNRTDDIRLLARSRPSLAPADMNPRNAVKIKARDSLVLPGFLTLPRGQAPRGLPAVVLVHGGPQGSDRDGFDDWAQFLASRGYAVLQVNFRGSTGLGEAHMVAGLRRWGLEMQDDLADATRWLAQQGIADAKRICIVGGSYGGYATLMGLAKSPELYKCGVSFAPVTDLVELGLDRESYVGGKEAFAAQVGSLDSERERLRSTSPRYLAEQMKAPLLLIHGTRDLSVNFLQSAMMVEAMQKAGKTNFRFIRQENGDHHLSVYEHRLQFYRELESFLAQNL